MTRIKITGLALLATFTAGSLEATVSLAAPEGPWWQVAGKRLAAGERAILLASAKEPFVLTSVFGKITCNALTHPVATERHIIGEPVKNGGISLEVMEFSQCKQEGIGDSVKCTVEPIKTNLILNLLGYGNAAREGVVLVLYEPETGKILAPIRFKEQAPEACKVNELPVEGTVVGVMRIAGVPIPIGSKAEALHLEAAFPHRQVIFIERGGALQEVKAGLRVAGLAAALSGVALLTVEPAGGGGIVKWGVFS